MVAKVGQVAKAPSDLLEGQRSRFGGGWGLLGLAVALAAEEEPHGKFLEGPGRYTDEGFVPRRPRRPAIGVRLGALSRYNTRAPCGVAWPGLQHGREGLEILPAPKDGDSRDWRSMSPTEKDILDGIGIAVMSGAAFAAYPFSCSEASDTFRPRPATSCRRSRRFRSGPARPLYRSRPLRGRALGVARTIFTSASRREPPADRATTSCRPGRVGRPASGATGRWRNR